MILNLLNTIAIAVSIGTSVNNTNFEHKSRKQAIQTINETYYFNGTDFFDESWVDVGNIADRTNVKISKAYLSDDTNGTNKNVNYVTNYSAIMNTAYSMYGNYTGTNSQISHTYTFLKIYNYYQSVLDISINVEIFTSNANAGGEIKIYTGYDVDNYIDLTLTNGNAQLINNFTQDKVVYRSKNINVDQLVADEETINTGQLSIASGDSENICFQTWCLNRQQDQTCVSIPMTIHINGSVLVPETNQEIIDVPGLMFTILTLPFSFISQAFNLTIFPGTQYQLNFSNLFLTLIAVFILLWLIKHIFK